MKKWFLVLLFLIIPHVVNAENFVCFDENTMTVTMSVQGDCLKIGLCSDVDNKGIQENCFIATEEEYKKAMESFVKVDASIVDGSRVVDMSDDEINAIISAQQQSIEVEQDAKLVQIDSDINGTDVGQESLTKTDAEIDAIGSLDDAKIFIKKLVHYISSNNVNN